MVKKSLGGSDLKLFPIGFGTGFNNTEYQNPKKLESIIQEALSLGVNFIDTAEGYGPNGLSEEIVGQAIKGQRQKVILATKFSPENSSSNDVIKSCHASLKRLDTDYIDLYQFHWKNPQIPLEQTFEGLIKLKKKGKIRYIGLGNFSKKDLKYAKQNLAKDLVISLQSELNLFEQFLIYSGTLNLCQSLGMSVISYSPLDQGRVNNLSTQQKKLSDQLIKKYSCTFTQIALSWLSSFESLIPIPKTTSKLHLQDNVEAANLHLTKAELKQLTEAFFVKPILIPIDQISVSETGERGRGGYQTLKEAIKNSWGLIPGPKEIASELEEDDFKPIRLIRTPNGQYSLINGRARFWAWVIKFGKTKPIPSYIRFDLPH